MQNQSRIFSDRSNCRRAAKKAAGDAAFEIIAADGGFVFQIAGDSAARAPVEQPAPDAPLAEPAPDPRKPVPADILGIVRGALQGGTDEISVAAYLASIAFGDDDERLAALTKMAGQEVTEDEAKAVADNLAQFTGKCGWTGTMISLCRVPVKPGRAATVEFAKAVENARRSPARVPAPTAPKAKAKELHKRQAKPGTARRIRHADVLAAAQRGVVPDAPDFSFAAHKPYLKDHARLVAMVANRDVAGLRAYPAKEYNSIVRALGRYRDTALVALTAEVRAAA